MRREHASWMVCAVCFLGRPILLNVVFVEYRSFTLKLLVAMGGSLEGGSCLDCQIVLLLLLFAPSSVLNLVHITVSLFSSTILESSLSPSFRSPRAHAWRCFVVSMYYGSSRLRTSSMDARIHPSRSSILVCDLQTWSFLADSLNLKSASLQRGEERWISRSTVGIGNTGGRGHTKRRRTREEDRYVSRLHIGRENEG